jgi:hypothetical protein
LETYKTLSLIGNILGLLLSFIGMAFGALIVGLSNVGTTTEEGGDMSLEQQQGMSEGSNFIGLAFLSLVLYGIMLALTFILKPEKSKILGIILLVLGFIAVITSLVWGIVAYALLIPAGILAIKHKPSPLSSKQPTYSSSDSSDDGGGGGIVGGKGGGGGRTGGGGIS